MKRLQCLLLIVSILLTQFACSMNDLPRNMALKAFDPHRKSFECKHEADVVPPIDPEADEWLHEGLALTSLTLWQNQRNYPKAIELWTKAAERKHWKAMLNLASAYANGEGVPEDTEHAVQIVESAMKLGIPGAFDMMGTFHMEGRGVKQDASRAYAFWELAADMGSASAQAYLGDKLGGTYDDPPDFWGNRPIALKMLECGVAQGNGNAAYQLGLILNGEVSRDYPRALRVLHEGVKFGCAKCAGSLSGSFSAGDPIVGGRKDETRGDRYSAIADVLELDTDLRLPNLDKVLPLPPARLPMWDGKKESLINAAKAVVPKPVAPVKPPASAADAVPPPQRTGRAHLPEGFALPERPQIDVPPQYESTRALVSGYWIARLVRHSEERHLAWDEAQWPMRYARDELFDRGSRDGLRDDDGRILFHYVGDPVPYSAPEPQEHPLVARGIARYGELPEPPTRCKGSAACPKTGIWSASVAKDHPHAAVFNQWQRQSYVAEGEAFPDPRQLHLDIEPSAVTWRWWSQSNDIRNVFLTYIRVDEPNEPAADPTPAPEVQAEADAGPQAVAPASDPTQDTAPAKTTGLLGRLWPWRG